MKEDWVEVELGEITELNPKLLNKNEINRELEVQFLPMKLVEEVSNKIHLDETRKFNEVQKKSYTYFSEGDVLFAKVTPCMENGKIAIATNLKNGIGYGSSEFHVFRCSQIVLNNYLFHYLVQEAFRREAQHNMTGAVGLRRVPKIFIEKHKIPLAPLPIQRAIVSKIETLFSDLDNGIAELKKAQEQLKIYRQAVLKKAFEGELTPDSSNRELITLGSIIEKPNYGTSKKCSENIHGIPVLRIPNIGLGVVDSTELKYAEFEESEILKLALKEGDILIIRSNGSVNLVGKCALITKRDTHYLYAGYLIRLRPDLKRIDSKYLLYCFSSHELRIQIENKAKSTSGVNNINSGELQSLVIQFGSS